MTHVNINKKGIDLVDLSIRTYDNPMAQFTTDTNLLDASKDYVFSVTDLQVLCSEIFILPDDSPPITMQILERQHSNVPTSALLHVLYGTETHARNHRTVGGLLKQFSQFCRRFSFDQGNHAERNDQTRESHLLRLGLLPGGRLQLTGSMRFWNEYFIEFSPLANKAFSLDTQKIGDRYYLSHLDNNTPNQLVGALLGLIQQSNVTNTIQSVGSRSVYPLLDQRTYITVETHMPTLNNVRVVDTTQRIDRSIFRKAFDQSVDITLKFANSLIDQYTRTQKNYSGTVSFMDKSELPNQWNVLQSSMNLQIFRFELFIWYNKYHEATNSFKLTQYTPVVGHWDLGISFVSRYN